MRLNVDARRGEDVAGTSVEGDTTTSRVTDLLPSRVPIHVDMTDAEAMLGS